MSFMKRHADTLAIIGSILGAVLWMNNQIGSLEKEMASQNLRLTKDIEVIKTVLILQRIMPPELASNVETTE